jgi:hypothetical protein
VTAADVARVCEVANHAGLLAIMRSGLIGTKAGQNYKIIELQSYAIVARIVTANDPSIGSERCPNQLRVWHQKRLLLAVRWAHLPRIEMEIETYEKGDWENAILAEKLHSAEPDRGSEMPN